jgi:hypothetical protein
MTAKDFHRIALSLPGAEEGSHMGVIDFRVGGRIFATLAAVKQGYGNLMLTPEQQADFVGERPDIFLPVPGGWGRGGATHLRLVEANEDIIEGALRAAWKVRADKNAEVDAKKGGRAMKKQPAAASANAASETKPQPVAKTALVKRPKAKSTAARRLTTKLASAKRPKT